MEVLQEIIRGKIQELADGRVHQYEDVEAVILWVEWATRQDERENIIKKITNYETK